jgi:hypothetical protein
MTLNTYAECCYAQCLLCVVSLMLSVIMLNAVILNVVAPIEPCEHTLRFHCVLASKFNNFFFVTDATLK